MGSFGNLQVFFYFVTQNPISSPLCSEENLLTLERECFVQKISDFPGQISSSPPVALEGRLRNGGRYDKRTKTTNQKITTGRIRVCHHSYLSGPDEKPSVRLLPSKRSGQYGKECSCLQALRKADKNHPQAETSEILLGRLPNCLVEQPSRLRESESCLCVYLCPLR